MVDQYMLKDHTTDETFNRLRRTPYDDLLQLAKSRGYTYSVLDLYDVTFNKLLVANHWNMDDFVDEYNKHTTGFNKYTISDIRSSNLFVKRPHR